MAELDRQWLDVAGLTMTDVGRCLGISRQAVAKHVASETTFLTKERLHEICEGLTKVDQPRERKAAESLAEIAKTAGIAIDVKGMTTAQETLRMMTTFESREFWIFTSRPLELNRGSFLDFMAKNVFVLPRLAVYFVPDQSVGDSLRKAIAQAEREILQPSGLPFKADIYVIETSLADLVPHLMIRDPQSLCIQERADAPSGWVLTKSPPAEMQRMVELPEDYTQKLIELVRDADIGVGLKVSAFFPKKSGPVRARGIQFKELWKKISS